MYSFYCGLDLGQSQDYTAAAIIEEPVYIPSLAARWRWQLPGLGTGWISPASLPSPQAIQAVRAFNRDEGRPAHPPLSLRQLRRWPLGTPYPRIVDAVVALMARPPLADDCVLVVDATGVGAGIIDLFRERVERLVAVTITGGTSVTSDGPRRLHVPKRDLIAATVAALQTERLKIAPALPEAQTLVSELLNFRLKVNLATGHDAYEAWREGQHDDLVLATAMGVWFRDWYCAHLDAAAEEALHAGVGVEV